MSTVLCYGDSNTYGYVPETGMRYPRNVRYPGRLQMLLGDDYTVIEEGCNGRTTIYDDPIDGWKNGMDYLRPCLNSHKPVDIVNDLFKYVQVSDAVASESLSMGIVQKIDLGIEASENGGTPKRLPICRECLMPDNALYFTIGLNDAVLKQIGFSCMEDVLSALNCFAELQYNLQADIYADSAMQEVDQLSESNCVLGGGTGYLSKTILYALAVSQAKNVKEGRENGIHVVRAFMKEKFDRGNHERDRKLSPHTLKLTVYKNKMVLMGLCKVEVEQELC